MAVTKNHLSCSYMNQAGSDNSLHVYMHSPLNSAVELLSFPSLTVGQLEL